MILKEDTIFCGLRIFATGAPVEDLRTLLRKATVVINRNGQPLITIPLNTPFVPDFSLRFSKGEDMTTRLEYSEPIVSNSEIRLWFFMDN